MESKSQILLKKAGSWLLIFLASFNWPELLAWLTGALVVSVAGTYLIPLLPTDVVLAIFFSPDAPEIINTALIFLGLAVLTVIGLLIALTVFLLRKSTKG